MSVTARFKLENPDDLDATMTITMSVYEWRAVRKEVAAGSSYAGLLVTRAIDSLLADADKVFYSRQSEAQP